MSNIPRSRIGKQSKRRDILSKLGETAYEPPSQKSNDDRHPAFYSITNTQPPRQSLYAWLVGEYLSRSDICSLCRVSRQDYEDVSRVLYRVVNLPFEGVWATDENAEKTGLELFLTHVAARRARNAWVDDVIQEIVIRDGYVPPESELDHVRAKTLMTDLLLLMETLTALKIFRWDSRVPFSESLFTVLANKAPDLRECQFKIDANSRRDLKIPRLRNQGRAVIFPRFPDLASEEEEWERFLKAREEEPEANPPRRRISGKSIILLKNADYRSVLRLSDVISKYFVEVDQVRIYGPTTTPLTKGEFQYREPNEGTVRVKDLRLGTLGNVARYFIQDMDIGHLKNLEVDWCIELGHILYPLMGRAKRLSVLKIIFPPRNNGQVDISTPTQFKQEHRYVSDFLRSSSASLRHLTIDGSTYCKDDATSVLLSGIQPHLPTLEELTIGDLEPAFTISDLRELSLCALHLRDLRISLSRGLLEPFMQILPEFRSLQILALLNMRLSDAERRAVVLVLQQAGRNIPLRLFGVEDEKEGTRLYAFRRRPENAMKPFPILDEIPVVEAVASNPEFIEFTKDLNRWARKLGVPVRGEKEVDPAKVLPRASLSVLGTEVDELKKERGVPGGDPWLAGLYGWPGEKCSRAETGATRRRRGAVM